MFWQSIILFLGITSCQTTLVPANMLSQQFEDGTRVYSNHISEGYIYREGHNFDGDCRVSRTEVEILDYKFFMVRLNGTTETCSGKNCEHCTFRASGGCACKNLGQGVCTHTITRNRDILVAK
jgi:hypothetical protein